MTPTVVAHQLQEAIRQYLRTAFSLSDAELERELFAFLAGQRGDPGLFKGPYLDVRLPFKKAQQASSPDAPLDVMPPFPPYEHQATAFERLSSKGKQPEHTLVVTGTGSGKTECFLYPVLDDAIRRRNAGVPGIKAIILYPMNALATDQARRIADLVHQTDALHGLRVGLYVGGDGKSAVMQPGAIIDQRAAMRSAPPDVLLTNYRMLDLLLMRPDDKSLWAQNAPGTLRYLVLDELHTYDGAQGSDVACLIRRLRARLGATAETLCCVGTSATIGEGDNESRAALAAFAGRAFGDPTIDTGAIVGESRVTLSDFLPAASEARDELGAPPEAEDPRLDPAAFETPEQWWAALVDAWLPAVANEVRPHGGRIDVVALGRMMRQHDMTRRLLHTLGKRLRSYDDVVSRVSRFTPELADHRDTPVATRYLDSFLALLALAKNQDNRPLFSIQVQLWLREVRRLSRRVSESIQFAWPESLPADDALAWAPIVRCRECGLAGIGAVERDGEAGQLRVDPAEVGQHYLDRHRSCRFVQLGETFGDLIGTYLFGDTLLVGNEQVRADGVSGVPCVVTGHRTKTDLTTPKDGKHERSRHRCPRCLTDDGLGILGARAASLTSAAALHTFLSPHNPDKKLLAFTDSVQDASHRAAFFGARTWRFTVRTALQAVIDAHPAGLTLDELGAKVFDVWLARLGEESFIATFTPPDMRLHELVQRFNEQEGGVRKPRSHKKLLGHLRERLAWEAIAEFGYGARRGQTLERVGVAAAEPELERVDAAAEAVAAWWHEEAPFEVGDGSAASIALWLDGLLHRLRLRGGIYHPMLQRYLERAGKSFELSKVRQPWLPPFPRSGALPRFYIDYARSDVFEIIPGNAGRDEVARGWFRTWAERALGVPSTHKAIDTLTSVALQALKAQGVLRAVAHTKGVHSWALEPEAITVTGASAGELCTLISSDEEHREPVSRARAERWLGSRVPAYRSDATWHVTQPPDAADYYASLYRSGQVERIHAKSHTGLLERQAREDLELAFKRGEPPGAANLVVCTPTLEMGIDVGDLSATFLCSTPPTTANYLQRIGRAGRSTGNALVLTLATTSPHDQYFFADPMLMSQGQVLPPGCFLDAPAMLRRQLIAFTFDAWTQSTPAGYSLPNKLLAIRTDDDSRFPGDWITWVTARVDALCDAFVGYFTRQSAVGTAPYEMSIRSEDALRDFLRSGEWAAAVTGAFGAALAEREQLKRQIGLLKAHAATLDAQDVVNPAGDGQTDLQTNREENAQALRTARARLLEATDRNPLNILTDSGVLPNYAFPEPGVVLKSSIRRARSAEGSDAPKKIKAEYQRPARAAIREFAPLNTFYADGQQYRITEVDLGSKESSYVERWRVCDTCPHHELAAEDAAPDAVCPVCESTMWPDPGQVREVVRLRGVRSYVQDADAVTADESEERSTVAYDLLDLIDPVELSQRHARHLPDAHFGVELLREQEIVQLNVGKRQATTAQRRFAGEQVPDAGFVLCSDCGAVEEWQFRQRARGFAHSPICPVRRLGKEERPKSVWLSRAIKTDVVWILLPMSLRQTDAMRYSFKAGLSLGLRRHLLGNPQHIALTTHTRPDAQGTGKLHFVVLYDLVPGGTGQLADLVESDQIRLVFEKALDAVRTCACVADPTRDGCYRCVYGYQRQYEQEHVSRRMVQEQFELLLSRWGDLQQTESLAALSSASVCESELEEDFLETLREHVQQRGGSWVRAIHEGRSAFRFTVGEHRWLLRLQVELDAEDGAPKEMRPDFVLTCESDASVRASIIECDGAEFHVMAGQPQGRVSDDLYKRTWLIESGRWIVWSMTKDDVLAARGDKGALAFDDLGKLSPARDLQRQQLHAAGQLPQAYAWLGLSSLQMLFAWLAHPVASDWSRAVELQTGLLLEPNTVDAAAWRDALLRLHDAGLPAADPRQPGADLNVSWRRLSFVARADVLRRTETGVERQIVLRIDDQAEARADANFADSWRALLHTLNVVQFGSRLLVSGADLNERFGGPICVEPAAAPALQETDEAAELWDLAFELVADDETGTLHATLRSIRAAGWEPPDSPYELNAAGDMLTVAWPERRVAIEDDATIAAKAGADWRIVTSAQSASVLRGPDDV